MSSNDNEDSMYTLPRDTAPPYAQVVETPTPPPPHATPHSTSTSTTSMPTTFMRPVYVVATPVDASIAASNNIPMVEVVTVWPMETDTQPEETGQQKKKRKLSEYNARTYQTKKAKDKAKTEQIETLLSEKKSGQAELTELRGVVKALRANMHQLLDRELTTIVSAATGSSRSHSEEAAYNPHGDTESDDGDM